MKAGDYLSSPTDPKPIRIREVKGDMVTLDKWQESAVLGGHWLRLSVAQLVEEGYRKVEGKANG